MPQIQGAPLPSNASVKLSLPGPADARTPSPYGMEEVHVDAPSAGRVPAGHFLQWVAPAPAYCPYAQGMHADASVLGWAVPGAHGVHADDAGRAENVPARHLRQEVPA